MVFIRLRATGLITSVLTPDLSPLLPLHSSLNDLRKSLISVMIKVMKQNWSEWFSFVEVEWLIDKRMLHSSTVQLLKVAECIIN